MSYEDKVAEGSLELERACYAWLDAKLEAERVMQALAQQELNLRQTVKRVIKERIPF